MVLPIKKFNTAEACLKGICKGNSDLYIRLEKSVVHIPKIFLSCI